MLGFFYFFLIEFNILRNAQSSLAPRRRRKKPQQHPLTLPPCASQQTFPNKCWRWQTGPGARGWQGGNCVIQSPAPRPDGDGEHIMRGDLLIVDISHTWQVWGAQSKTIIAFCCVMDAQLSQPAANQGQREAPLRSSIQPLSKAGS